jgi:enoyl-CoA hydratase/carnithine racemase
VRQAAVQVLAALGARVPVEVFDRALSDPYEEVALMSRSVEASMRLWRSPKPVIAQVQGLLWWAAGLIWRRAAT